MPSAASSATDDTDPAPVLRSRLFQQGPVPVLRRDELCDGVRAGGNAANRAQPPLDRTGSPQRNRSSFFFNSAVAIRIAGRAKRSLM